MRFFLLINGQSEGPFTVEEIEDLHGAGRVNRSTPCRREKEGEWSSIYNLVPTAIWVNFPRNRPVSMGGDRHSRRGLPKNLLWVGVSCLVALFLVILLAVFLSDWSVRETVAFPAEAMLSSQKTMMGEEGMVHPGTQAAMRQNREMVNKQIEDLGKTFRFFAVMQMLVVIVGLMLFAFWLWMLIEMVTNEPQGSEKITWTLIVVLTGPIGAGIYFIVRYLKREPTF